LLKTITLSYLLPDEEVISIENDEVTRGPREQRVDTGPNVFHLKLVPRDHPVLSIVVLEREGTKIASLMCDRLSAIAAQKNSIKANAATIAVLMQNALQIISVYRPSVRSLCIDVLYSSSEAMKEVKGEEASPNKLRFVQNMTTALLEFLKEKWHGLLKDWRSKICEAITMLGAADQAEKAMMILKKKDQRKQAKLDGKAEKERELEERRNWSEQARRKRMPLAEALDAAEMRKLDYPPQRNTMAFKTLNNLHELTPSEAAKLVITFMDFLPGPPPPTNPRFAKPEAELITTFAQFTTFLEKELATSKAKVQGKSGNAAALAASKFKVTDTIEPRKLALERMLEQHKTHVPMSALSVFTPDFSWAPSPGDALIARVACDFVRRNDVEAELDLRPIIIQFVAEDLTRRFGLALSTLFHLYAFARSSQTTGTDVNYEYYDDLFLMLMETLLDNGLDKPGYVVRLSRLFTVAPRLPPGTLGLLVHFCETSAHLNLGLMSLRDVILNRSAMRKEALDALMYFSTSADTKVRMHSIVCMTRDVYSRLSPTWKSVVEDFALGMLQTVVDASAKVPSDALEVQLNEAKQELLKQRPGEVFESRVKAGDSSGEDARDPADEKQMDIETESKAQEEEHESAEDGAKLGQESKPSDFGIDRETSGPTAGSEQATNVMRRIQIYISLCKFNKQLLQDYMKAYAAATEENLRKAMESAVLELVRYLASTEGPAETLALFQGFPNDAAPLLIQVLRQLVDEKNISNTREKRLELVEQAKAIRDEHHSYTLFESDDQFVIPILGSLTRTEIRQYLIRIVGMDNASVKEAINSILVGARFAQQRADEADAGEEEDLDTQPLLPADLMHTLVTMDLSDDVTEQNLRDATDLCFERRDMFTKDVLEDVIKDLLEEKPLARLTMRIMIKSMEHQPQIKPFVTTALKELAERQFWTMDDPGEDLWKGFVICALKVSTPAYPILLGLPQDQFEKMLGLVEGPSVARLVYYARQNQQNLELSPEKVEQLEAVGNSNSSSTRAGTEPVSKRQRT